MSKIDSVLLFLAGLFCCVITHAATIDALIAQQREATNAVTLKKVGDTKIGTTPPLPGIVDLANVPVVSNVSPLGTARIENNKVDDLRLIAVYGLERNLTADIYYNGVVLSVAQGGETVDGWRVQTITSSRVILQQLIGSKKKMHKTHVLYLSDPTVNTTTPNAQDINISGVRGGISPMRNAVSK